MDVNYSLIYYKYLFIILHKKDYYITKMEENPTQQSQQQPQQQETLILPTLSYEPSEITEVINYNTILTPIYSSLIKLNQTKSKKNANFMTNVLIIIV